MRDAGLSSRMERRRLDKGIRIIIANLMLISPYQKLCVSLIASQILLVFLGLSAVQTGHLLPIGCQRAPDSAWREVKSRKTHIIVKINLELSLPILGARDQNQMALEHVMATGPLNLMIWAGWRKMMIRKSNSTIAITSRCGRTPDLLEVSSQDYVGSPTQKVADAPRISRGNFMGLRFMDE